MSKATGIPGGWFRVPLAVYTNGKAFVLTGEPPAEEDDPDCEQHHCDSMGCGLEHVLVAVDVPDYARPLMERHVAAEAAKLPKPATSLRLEMLKRKGKLEKPTDVPIWD